MRKAALKPCKRKRTPAQKAIPLDELRMWIDTLTNTAQAQVVDNDKTIFDREPVLVGLWSRQEIDELKNKIKVLHSWIASQ
jgi:hypothetical protein